MEKKRVVVRRSKLISGNRLILKYFNILSFELQYGHTELQFLVIKILSLLN